MIDRPRPGRAAAVIVGIAALATATLLAAPSGGGAEGQASATQLPAPSLSRIVSARLHHTRISTVRNTNAGRIGRALASLQPTWVSGLIRYARNQHPNRAEVRTWRRVTGAVRESSPEAQFDVVLNARQYKNGRQLRAMMQRVRTRLDNDGWFFDFLSVAHRRRPGMIRAAAAAAHAHGEWLGGNVFGFARRGHPIPLAVDFLAVQDFRLRLDLHAVRRLSVHLPVVYHLHNDPDRQRGGGCRFIESLSTTRRRELIRRRARQQDRYGFRVSYPALFPECKRQRGRGRDDILYSYNAFRDPPMAAEIRRLLDLYD